MVSSDAQKFYDGFALPQPNQTEADIQFAIAAFITAVPLGLNSDQVKAEKPTGDGTRRRIDIAYGRLVIEVKKALDNSKVLADGEKQLGDYLRTLLDQTGVEFAGILTDGREWYLYALDGESQVRVDAFVVDGSEQNPERLRLWLETILLTGQKLPVDPTIIAERLGTESPRFRLDRKRLEVLFNRYADHPTVVMKRELWARLLRTAFGTSFSNDESLFVDHTLLVLEAEIIAHLTVGIDLSTVTVQDVVRGEQFHTSGTANVVEADFFDWPAEVADGGEFVASLIRELSQFDWSNLKHDVLKLLYEAVIDSSVRKKLGEYYTPDWLAVSIVDAAVTDPLTQRVMDPACGSGTFLFHSVQKFLVAADEAGMSNSDALDLLQSRVLGMDIHPVSVVLARVTYLLAIGTERLAGDRNALAVPVYLGDSVQWARGAGAVDENTIRIDVDAEDLATVETEAYEALWTAGQRLAFPFSSLMDPTKFDTLVGELAELAQTYHDENDKLPSIAASLDRLGITDTAERTTLRDTFEVMCRLNAAGRDHIWGYYVRNQIRPLWLSLPQNRVDVLVGNPPWVAYRFLSKAMQSQFKLMSEARNLWHGGKLATQQDLVGLFIARSVEQFLVEDGTFAYVAPFAVLSRMQYEGFRKGTWAKGAVNLGSTDSVEVHAAFDIPWDLSGIKPPPFPVPSAVIFGHRRAESVILPAETIKLAGSGAKVTSSAGSIVALSADDVDLSPYAARPVQGATMVPRMMWFVVRKPAPGIGLPSGAALVTSLRTPQEKKPYKDLGAVEGTVEKSVLFPTLVGTSVAPFRVVWSWLAALPIDSDGLLSASEIQKRPLYAKRLATLNALWDGNKNDSNNLSLVERLDYQRRIRKQLPAAHFRVVYTKSGNRLAAAVLTDESAVIDHTLYCGWHARPRLRRTTS